MEKNVRVQQLFNDMQAAERDKDVDPIAYTKARIAYNTESNGQKWVAEEEERLGKDADVTINGWKVQYDALKGLQNTHLTNLNIVRGATQQTDELNDDLAFAVGELDRRIQGDEDSAILKSRNAFLLSGATGPTPWVMNILDGMIVLLLLYVIYLLYSYLAPRWALTGAIIAAQAQAKAANALRQAIGVNLNPRDAPPRTTFL
jgi:hypothetical protein